MNMQMLRNRRNARRWQCMLFFCMIGVSAIGILSEIGYRKISLNYTTALQAQRTFSDLGRLLRNIADAESGQRGFLLTRDPAYLTSYNNAAPRIGVLMQKLAADYATTNTHIRELNDAVGKKMGEMEVTLTLADKNHWDDAVNILRTGVGRGEMDSIRSLVEQMQAEQETRGRAGMDDFMDAFDMARVSIAGSALLNVILLLLLAIWIRTEARRAHTSDSATEQAHDELINDRTEQLAALASRLQEVAEEEKKKLGHELHDELGALLTATKMDISWISSQLTASQSDLAEKMMRAIKNLEMGIMIKRRIIEGLRPTTLSSFGLVTAARDLIQQSADIAQWKMTLELPERDPQLTEEAEITLYRILQEALNNTLKYARATEVRVSLVHSENEYCKLEIEDNGVGFRQSDVRLKAAGLIGMQERLRARGGKLIIRSSPGQGTLVVALLPLSLPDRRAARNATAFEEDTHAIDALASS